MIELPDDELDKLFRKSSEELDPQFDPEDWDSLRKRLDETDGKTPAAWFRKWWPLGVLAVLIPLGIVLYRFGGENGGREEGRKEVVLRENGGRKERRKEKAGGLSGAVGGEKKVGADNEDAANSKKEISNNLKAGSENTGESSSISDLKAASPKSRKILPRSLSKAGGVYLEPNRSKREGGDGALSLNADEKVHKNDPKGTSVSELGARQATGSNGVTPNGAVTGSNADLVNVSPVTGPQSQSIPAGSELVRMQIVADKLGSKELNWANQIDYPKIAAPAMTVKEQEPEKEENEPVESPKWAIRLGYSPDLTTVGFKNFTKPGTAFSLLFEYGVTKRLYLQTGVVRTEKDYYAPGHEYKFKYYVTSINTPDSLDGVCLMYEIPLGIRYDLIQKANSRLFAGTGFSSYYIQKEKYTYYYKDYKHNQKPGWEGKSGLTLFSHLNASIGYERKITHKLSILAEPYIRIPLKGVGYGKVNLTTMGMWLSLRYTPAFR